MPKPFIERKNNAILDVIELQKEGYTDIHFQGVHLLGGSESNKPYNECFFGELDSKNTMGLDDIKPIYHLQASDEIIESTSNNRDSSNADSNNSLSTLDVFLNGSKLTILIIP